MKFSAGMAQFVENEVRSDQFGALQVQSSESRNSGDEHLDALVGNEGRMAAIESSESSRAAEALESIVGHVVSSYHG